MRETILRVVHAKVSPEKEQEYLRFIKTTLAPAIRNSPGCRLIKEGFMTFRYKKLGTSKGKCYSLRFLVYLKVGKSPKHLYAGTST